MSPIPQAALRRDIHIVVPFYKNPDLVAPLLKSLMDCREELAELRCAISIINDSADDVSLASELEEAVSRIPVDLPCTVTTNQTIWDS